MIARRHLLSAACAGGLAFIVPGGWQSARSQAAHNGARILVGFTPGGPIDVVARLLIDQMKDYARPFIVDNRPGASERIALEALKAGAPDGSVLMLTGGSPIAVFPHTFKKLNYDPLLDFIPVTTVCTFPFVLTVGPMVPAGVKTLADFIAWCRVNPGLATYGTIGAGSPHHFIGFMLQRAGGFDMVHVPYQGPGGVQDLLGGRIAATIYPPGATLPYIQAGTLRALMTTGTERSALLPDVPTIREAGYPAIELTDWFGVFVPANTPAEIVDTLNKSVREALKANEVKAGLRKLFFEPAGSSPGEFARLVKSKFDLWGEVVQASGFRAEE